MVTNNTKLLHTLDDMKYKEVLSIQALMQLSLPYASLLSSLFN